MLWLPLQGYAATMMPFCPHKAHDQHAQHSMSQHAQSDQDSHASHHLQHPDQANTHDDCSLCHMCSAMALPSFADQVHFKPEHFFAIPAQAAYSPIVLEQPQRPPLAQLV